MARPPPRFFRAVPVIAQNLPRAWFSPEEYKKLYEATRKRTQEPKQERYKWESQQLDDYGLFAVNTGLRPDEAWRLEFRDVTIVDDEDLGKTILEIEVRGKRGVGYCKSMPGAVRPFERLKSRLRPARVYGVHTPTRTSETSAVLGEQWRTPGPTDLIFPKWQRELFKTIELRSADDPGSEKEIVDPNAMSEKGAIAIDFYVPSIDGKLVAVSLSEGGSEDGTAHVFETATGKELSDRVPRVNFGTAGGSFAWNADGSGFYYTRYPQGNERRSEDMNFYQQVFFHKLGTESREDRYVIGKDFPRIAEIHLQSSEDGKWILAAVANGDGGQ